MPTHMDKTLQATDSTTACSSSIWPCWTASRLEREQLWALAGERLDGWVGMGAAGWELEGKGSMSVMVGESEGRGSIGMVWEELESKGSMRALGV